MKVAIVGATPAPRAATVTSVSPSSESRVGARTTPSFSLRRFAALTAALSGLCLPFSGLQLHLHQLDSILSTSRHSWMAIHTALGVLFLVAVVTHAVFNRRALANHVFGGLAHATPSREAVAAFAVVAIVLFVAATHAFR